MRQHQFQGWDWRRSSLSSLHWQHEMLYSAVARSSASPSHNKNTVHYEYIRLCQRPVQPVCLRAGDPEFIPSLPNDSTYSSNLFRATASFVLYNRLQSVHACVCTRLYICITVTSPSPSIRFVPRVIRHTFCALTFTVALVLALISP